METKQIKYISTLVIKGVILLLAFLWIFQKCKKDTPIKIEHKINLVDSIITRKNNETANLINRIKTIENRVDSLKNLKIKIKYVLKVKHDSILISSPDTCSGAINEIYNWCTKIDSVNSLVISKQDSMINDYKHIIANNSDVVMLKDYQLSQKTDSINSLRIENKSLRKSVRNEKLKGWGKTLIGGLAGFELGNIIK